MRFLRKHLIGANYNWQTEMEHGKLTNNSWSPPFWSFKWKSIIVYD